MKIDNKKTLTENNLVSLSSPVDTCCSETFGFVELLIEGAGSVGRKTSGSSSLRAFKNEFCSGTAAYKRENF